MPIRLATLLLVLVAAHPRGARADETAPSPLPGVDVLVQRLGRPARAEALEAIVVEHGPLDQDSARRLARALGKTGGRTAAVGLVQLLEGEDAGVREEALRAAAHVGVRYEPLARRARWILTRSSSSRERQLAALALGCVGDGRDVPLLLERAEARYEAEATRASAFRALSTLGGVSISDDAGRWRAWWEALARRDRPDVARALLALSDGEPKSRDAYRQILHRNGWLDLVAVRTAAAAWLIDPDPQLRQEACRLVEVFRIADLGPTVANAKIFDLQRVYRTDADAALRAVGMASTSSENAPPSESAVPDTVPRDS